MVERQGPLQGVRVTLVGQFGGTSRREVTARIRQAGGIVGESLTPMTRMIVIGEGEVLTAQMVLRGVSPDLQAVFAEQKPEILFETQLWQRLDTPEHNGGTGDTESESETQNRSGSEEFAENANNTENTKNTEFTENKLYTLAMLAELLRVPIPVIRRWCRGGLLIPAREVRRLAYFDFRGVATAHKLAEMLAHGMSTEVIERNVRRIGELVGDSRYPLEHVSLVMEGRRLLLRREDGLIEPGGQRYFDFEMAETAQPRLTVIRAEEWPTSSERNEAESIGKSIVTETDSKNTKIAEDNKNIETNENIEDTENAEESTIPLPQLASSREMSGLLEDAAALEDAGRIDEAIQTLRMAAALYQSQPETNFRLAELLYRSGDKSAARERYFMAIELDEDYVEARASLGCVLVEEGKTDLAIAAFEGALKLYPEYADVHFHLAKIYQDRYDEAVARYERDRMPLFPECAVEGDGPVSTLSVAAQRDRWGQLASRYWRRFLELAPSGPWADEAEQRLAELERTKGGMASPYTSSTSSS